MFVGYAEYQYNGFAFQTQGMFDAYGAVFLSGQVWTDKEDKLLRIYFNENKILIGDLTYKIRTLDAGGNELSSR